MSFVNEWDGRNKPTQIELERIAQWWNESADCCPEAVAMDIRFVYPTADSMMAMVKARGITKCHTEQESDVRA
jgi:hypothetical protein